MIFGSSSLVTHLGRGILGMLALAAGLRGYDVVGWPSLLLLGVTLWALRGCPVCWTIGLFETIAFKVFGSVDATDARHPHEEMTKFNLPTSSNTP